MTDPQNAQPQDASVPGATPAPPAPPAAPYDAAPYPPAATYPPATDAPAPPYAPPAYPASPYASTPSSPYASGPYGGTSSPYGAQYPMQTTPGAPPIAPYSYGAYPARRTNGLAVASMILSIVGFIWILPLIGSVAGAIMGHIALGQIRRTGESGRGMALAGVIVGWAGVALLVIGVLFIIFVTAAAGSSSYRYGA